MPGLTQVIENRQHAIRQKHPNRSGGSTQLLVRRSTVFPQVLLHVPLAWGTSPGLSMLIPASAARRPGAQCDHLLRQGDGFLHLLASILLQKGRSSWFAWPTSEKDPETRNSGLPFVWLREGNRAVCTSQRCRPLCCVTGMLELLIRASYGLFLHVTICPTDETKRRLVPLPEIFQHSCSS